jgi:hypothetical protein
MATVGTAITAAEYNNLQSRITTILGTGSGSDGYGQTVRSSQVSATAIVTAQHMQDLYLDMEQAREHQTGTPPTWVIASDGLVAPQVGDLVGADQSYNPTTETVAQANTAKGYNDFANAMSDIEADKFLADSSQMSLEVNQLSSQRTNPWNGSIFHEFTVTFSNADQRRHFFNTGGNIRINSSLSGGTSTAGVDGETTYPDTPAYTKDEIWQTMLNNSGTVIFSRATTTTTGTGNVSAVGSETLVQGAAYVTIFSKSGTGVYAENDYTIKAKSDAANTITFRVEYNDNDLGDQRSILPGPFGPAVDEDVTGTITNTISQLRATGAINITSPGYTTNSALQ